MMLTRRNLLAASAAWLFGAADAAAQEWPQRSVRVIVPFGPGGEPSDARPSFTTRPCIGLHMLYTCILPGRSRTAYRSHVTHRSSAPSSRGLALSTATTAGAMVSAC